MKLIELIAMLKTELQLHPHMRDAEVIVGIPSHRIGENAVSPITNIVIDKDKVILEANSLEELAVNVCERTRRRRAKL